MGDNFIHYEFNGKRYKIPTDKKQDFESKAPDAKIMLTFNGKSYGIPLSEVDNFIGKAGVDNVTYSEYDDNKEYSPKLSTRKYMSFEAPDNEVGSNESMATPVVDKTPSYIDAIKDPNLSGKEKRKIIREAKRSGEMPNTFETIGKSIGTIGTSIGGMVVDAANLGMKMSRLQNPAIGLPDIIELKTGKPIPEELRSQAQVDLDKASEKLQGATEKLSMGADPTGGQMDFVELVKAGRFGLAMQKGLGSTIESAPMMVASRNPYTAAIYMVGMAASNYADETRENPDIPMWKRAANAAGSAALEMAIEKVADPLKSLLGNGASALTEEAAKEIIEKATKEGVQTISKRILRALGNTIKDAAGEGLEEVGTSLGNDALGSALDAIDKDRDYGFKAQWEEYKAQNPNATKGDFANAKAKEYLNSFLGGALSGVYMSSFANAVKETQDARARKQFDDAYTKGTTGDYRNLYDVDDAVKKDIEKATKAFTSEDGTQSLSEEYIAGLSAEAAFALSRNMDLPAKQRLALGNLAIRKAQQEGLNNGLNERVDSEVNANRAIINGVAENGDVVIGRYNGNPVYVKGGVTKNGTVTLPSGEAGPVVVINTQTGEKQSVNSKDIVGALTRNAEELANEAEQIIRGGEQRARELARNTMSPLAKLNSVRPYAGKKILVNLGNGVTEVYVQQVSPNGEVLIKGKKGDLGGQSFLTLNSSTFYDSIHRDAEGNPTITDVGKEEQEQYDAIDTTEPTKTPEADVDGTEDFKEKGTHTILISGKPVEVEVTYQDNASDTVNYEYVDESGNRKVGSTTVGGFKAAIQQAEQYKPTESPAPENENPTPVEPIGTDIPAETTQAPTEVPVTPETIDWDALFEQDTEAYFAELQKQFGEGAADVINMEIAATQKELDKLEKNQGATRTERVKNIGKIAKLRLEKGILEDMANRLQRKNEPISETAEVTETEQVVTPEVAATESITEPIDNSAEIEIPEPRQIPLDKKNSEPINGVELAANELGKKQGIKLLWDSVQHHTGYGDGEKKKFFGLFRTKEKGGMDLETAGERLMEIDREYGFNFFDQNDPNAGMNAILEALGANSTVGDLRSYTARMRQAEAQEYENAAYKEAMERFYEERGESYDDYKAYNEQLRDELKSGYALSDEQLNEYNATLAEEYDRYDRERNATENEQGEDGPVRTTEDIGDLPLAEGEAHGGSEGSNQVLRETQTVQQGGDRHAEGGRPSVGVSAQDAGIPVHGTEEGESVSTLDEDMPDFTTEAPKAPVAPKSVDNPIAEAQKREDSLISQLSREEIPFKQRQDLAYNAGKAVADFFATREEYDAYEEVAADLGEFIEDFDRGVEASFANRNQYHIGEVITESEVSEEAIDLVNALIDSSLEGVVDVERASDEQTKEVLALGGIENQFSVETDKPIFISNAALAVQGIKMEKATPEQWLKMIEKAGGLKAGEDKWMRLSDWLKASDKKTLTKQEVLDYINENTIQIEEEHYSESAEDNATIVYGQMRDILQGEFNHYRAEYYEEHEDDDFYGNPAADYAIEKLRNYFGDTQFPYDIEVDYSGDVYFKFYHEDNADMEKWAKKLGVKYEPQNPINSTRQMYTSDGLENKKEIALIVPTIKSWGEWDDVHFGDAGKGRAVAWVRFGDTEVIEETEESKEIASALHELANDARQKYGEKRSAWPDDVRAAYDMLLESQLDSMRHRKILVIDEIQSKRHQEGRDKGYSMSIEEYEQRLNALETERAERLKRRTILLKQLKEKYGDDFNSYLKLQDTAYVPNENVMTPEEVQEWYATTQDEIDSAIDNLKKEMRTGIPAAPFEKNWPELAMKRMLRYAAENGYDEVAWTSGKQQSDRYNLGKVVNSIISADNGETKRVRIFLKNSDSLLFDVDSKTGKVVSVHHGDMVSVGANLSDVVGKDMADGILNNTGAEDNEGRYHWSGEGLRVGTSGMAAFYDKMLPAFMSKYGKKWGVSVSETELPLVEADEGYTFHSVPVTEAMKDSVMEGQPMFFKTPNGIVYGWTDGKKIYLTKAGMNPNTKIHEYTHLWAKAMMQKNPKGWNRIKQLLKGTPVWNEVMNDANYSDIHGNEDAVASEVLSRISGTKNAAKLEQMAQKMIDEAKGTMRKAEARGLIQNIKDALNKFWSWVGKNLFEIENFNSIDEITDRVLYDLVNKTDLGTLSEGQVEAQMSKSNIEKIYGGLWIADKQEFAKFASAVEQYVFEEDGKGIAYTDNHFYAYYWNIDGKPIPYVDIYLNSSESQSVVNKINEEYGIEGNQSVGAYIDRAYEVARDIQNRRNDISGSNQSMSSTRRNDSLGRNIQRKGRYYFEPSLYVTSSRPDGRVRTLKSGEAGASTTINPIYNSKRFASGYITSEMDAEYLAAVESGDMETAQRMVLEAAKIAMPNTKVVDENGNPKIVYHGSPYGGITVFNRKIGRSKSGLKEFGNYFSSNEKLAEIYKTEKKINDELKQDITDEIYRLRAIQENIANLQQYDAIEEEIKRLKDTLDGKIYRVFLNIENPKTFNAKGKDGYDGWFELRQDVGYDIKKGTEAIEAIAGHNDAAIMPEKYDGIIAENISDAMLSDDMLSDFNGDVFLVFDENPHQIKSAEPVTYDNTGKVIPLSHRFNFEVNDIRYRKSDAQNIAVNYLAGDARLKVIENAVNDEAAKLGVKVTYKTREEMPAGHKNDKGYYNTTTGEIVICTENASSIADAIQTILHETVAHKGLRQLMGDKFNEFINRVYNSLDADTKTAVDKLAADDYDGNTLVAMEEYMASLAENENFKEQTIWEKIKTIFNNVINKILGRNDIKIGDNELRYLLRASYNNMVNPKGMQTLEGWAKDMMMRENYGINEVNTVTPEILSRTGIDPTEVASETARQVYDKTVNETWQEFQRQFQDAYQPVRIAIDAIQQETGNVPIEDYENFLLIQNQMSSRSRVEIDKFQRRYYSPIISQVNAIIDTLLAARGFNVKDKAKRAEVYKEVINYLIAKHGIERNKYYQSTKTRKMTAKEMKPELDDAQADYQQKVDIINMNNNLSDAERELQLRDALDEYNAVVQEIKSREVPDMRDYSGLTSLFGLDSKEYEEAERMAQEMVDNFEKSLGRVDNDEGEIVEQSEAIDKIWEKINKATDKTLRHSYESGLLSRQQYNDIKAMFKFYIPLRGFDETTAEDVYAYARFEGNRFNPAVQTAKGRTSVADDPIAIIMNMAESEIAQGNKNRAKQALYNYLLNRTVMGNDGKEKQNSLMQVEDVWYVKGVDSEGNEIYQIATPDRSRGESWEEFEVRMQTMAEEGNAYKSKKGKLDVGMRFQKQRNQGAHYVYLKVNGVEKAIYINGDPKAADAINGTYKPEPIYKKGSIRTKNEKVNKVIEFVEDKLNLANLNRFISSTFTNYSLEFTARNYFRDMIYSHINIGIKESDPAYRKKFRQNWRHNNLRTVKNMLQAYKNGEYEGRPLTEDEAAFVEFMENGGQTGYTLINSVESRKRDLERAIRNMQNGSEGGGVKDTKAFKATLGAIELLNESSELVTRFAAFKTSRDMGRSINKSISDAKEITVNFNTKGAQDGKGLAGFIARYFGWSKYFFNASVQGVQNIKAMAEANKLKFCSTVGGIAGLGFCMPIIAGALSELFGGDDDDENAYWNIPEYDRQNNLCIPVGNTYLKIPLPIGFREMYAIGDMVAAMAFDKKFTRDVSQVGMDIANKIASTVLPINPLESSANGLNFWHTFLYTALPSSAQFAIQNATNIDWKGVPLQKEYTYNEDDPQWMKAYASNPDWMVTVAKWCNENTQFGDYEGCDWSPEKLDNMLSNMLGGIYTIVKKTGKTISMAWNEESRTTSNIPLAGVVLGSGIGSDDMYMTDAYYDMLEYYDSNVNLIKRRAKQFGFDLDDVFVRKKGAHQPKMQEIYSNPTFEWMQEWYKGNKELEKYDDNVKKLEQKIAESDKPSETNIRRLNRARLQFEQERREFINDMLELD